MIQTTTIDKKFPTITTLSLATLIILLDQLVKHKIHLNGGFYVCNNGISFNLLIPSFLFWLTFSILLFLFFSYFYHTHKKGLVSATLIVGLGFLTGGAISNALDRAFMGCVFDYIFPFWHFLPVFNIADIAIFIGTTLLFFNYLKK